MSSSENASFLRSVTAAIHPFIRPFLERVAMIRPTPRSQSAYILPLPPSPPPPLAPEKVEPHLLQLQNRQEGKECSITLPTTTWLAPSSSICTPFQTILPCGTVVTVSPCPAEIAVVITTITLSQSPSPDPIASSATSYYQQNEGSPQVPGDYSQGKLNGIIIGTVLGVIVVVVAVFLWGNQRLIGGKLSRGLGDDGFVELEGPPRRPDGNGGGAGGGALPEAPAPAEPAVVAVAVPVPVPVPEPEPEPAATATPEPPPAPEAGPEAPPAAPPPTALDLALLPPAALAGNAAHGHVHAPPTPYPSPEPQPNHDEPSDDDGYVYPRVRRRRSSSESRVRFAEEAEIIPDRRPWREV